jgi:hypothetical protein
VETVIVWIRLVRDINTNGITNLESSGHPLWYLFSGEQSDRDVDFCNRLLNVDTTSDEPGWKTKHQVTYDKQLSNHPLQE